MDHDLIERLAREAGFRVEPPPLAEPGEVEICTLGWTSIDFQSELRRFAELVAEEAAKVAECCDIGPCPNVPTQRAATASAIRALFKEQ